MIHPADFHLHTHVRLLVTSWYCWVGFFRFSCCSKFFNTNRYAWGLFSVCVYMWYVCVWCVCSFSWFKIFYLYK